MNYKFYPAELTPEQLAANARIQADTKQRIEQGRSQREREEKKLLELIVQMVVQFI